MSTTTVQDLSLEHFNALMDMVDNHASTALGMISTGFSGPLPALSLGTLTEDATAASAGGGLAAPATLPSAAKAAFKAHKTTTVNNLNTLKSHTQAVTAAHVKKIQAGQNTPQDEKEFDAQIDAQTNGNVAAYKKDQVALGVKLKAIGHANPAARRAIVSTYAEVSKFILGKLSDIGTFFIGLLADIAQVLVKAVQIIGDTIAGAVSSVGSFLGGLLGL
jgi:hypothetical protein